jgi:hypothetical protein
MEMPMNDRDKKLQHALMSFALLGGILVSPRNRHARAESRPPQDFLQIPPKPR